MKLFVKVIGIQQIHGTHANVLEHIRVQDVKHRYLILVEDYV